MTCTQGCYVRSPTLVQVGTSEVGRRVHGRDQLEVAAVRADERGGCRAHHDTIVRALRLRTDQVIIHQDRVAPTPIREWGLFGFSGEMSGGFHELAEHPRTLAGTHKVFLLHMHIPSRGLRRRMAEEHLCQSDVIPGFPVHGGCGAVP